MGRKRKLICVLMCILLCGCSSSEGESESISGQSVSGAVVAESSAGEQIENEVTHELLPNQFVTFTYDPEEGVCSDLSFENVFTPNKMLNYEEAMEEMVFARPEERERIVVSYCDTFPEELQRAFQYEIEHYNEVDVHFGEYNTGLGWHTSDEFPYEWPYVDQNMYDMEIRYQELDLDGDGVMEYLFRSDCLQYDPFDCASVYKIIDGEPVYCFGLYTYELGVESLYYEGDYYLYMGNYLFRCGAGCDLLFQKYEADPGNYTPDGVKNTNLEYIVATYERTDYTWHEGYRLEGYEGIDFKAYLPEGLENHLPVITAANGTIWEFEAAKVSAGGKGQYLFVRFPMTVDVEGKEYEYVFLRRELDESGDRDVVVAVLEPGGYKRYNIVCMYSLINSYEYSLVDEREYIDELVRDNYLITECQRNWQREGDSVGGLLGSYQPNYVKDWRAHCVFCAERGKDILLLSYGEEGRAVITTAAKELETIYDETGAKFISAHGNYPGILEHILDESTGTESYFYYEICNDFNDVEVVLKDSFVRVDEDRDGLFTEQDSYYCNGYELEQRTWECWMIYYLKAREL
ncbi:MAG: hypothetical protein ACI4DW_00620 [Lachnospiraceae bacterium]